VAAGEPAPGLPGVTVAAAVPGWVVMEEPPPAGVVPVPLKVTAIEVSQASSGTIPEMSRITFETRISCR
jgi:hypothetical protein